MRIRSAKANAYDDYFNPPAGTSGEANTRSVVILERNGFMVDVALLNSKCAKAREDEEVNLASLRKDYRALRKDGKSDEDIDSVWSSSTKLVDLVHEYLKLPPSPIYKKGQVATWKGELRLDGVALDYLGNYHVEHRDFLHRIRTLRTIRGSIKYLSKLPTFVGVDGLIHPTYGPMGDDDERSGTATGRLGMKNPEGHQIPADSEKDPYGIRECFIPPPGQVLIVRDYQAMEVVILAYLCKLLFNDESLYSAVEMGSAFHSKNALSVFGHRLGWVHPTSGRPIGSYTLGDFKTDDYLSKLRKDAKTVWYGAQYRKSGRGFGFTLLDAQGQPIGIEAGDEVLSAFLEEAPALQKWYDFTDWWLGPGKHDYMPSPGGRVREMSQLLSHYRMTGKMNWEFKSAGRKLGNLPIQAMSAEIKMAAIHKCLNDSRMGKALMRIEIHDELHWSCLPELAEEMNALAKENMETAYPIHGLTTSGGTGPNWTEAK